MSESITGVALFGSDGQVIALPKPFRHHHLFALAAFIGRDFNDAKQGFMTSEGRFVGREEGQKIAMASGQHFKRSGSQTDTALYSEDVW